MDCPSSENIEKAIGTIELFMIPRLPALMELLRVNPVDPEIGLHLKALETEISYLRRWLNTPKQGQQYTCRIQPRGGRLGVAPCKW